MQFSVLTIFPHLIESYFTDGIVKRALTAGAISVRTVQLRDFTDDRHRTVDDTPYGGGAGMVMKPEPIFKALTSIDALPFASADGLTKLKRIVTGKIGAKKRTILLSPRGRQFDQRLAEQWATYDELVFVCGRYEGVDQRVADHMVHEEVSIGPYVLAGGELGALVMIEAITRLIPGVLGNPESLIEETFGRGDNESAENIEYPQYTKPAEFHGWHVPEILLTGNHKKIKQWRGAKQ